MGLKKAKRVLSLLMAISIILSFTVLPAAASETSTARLVPVPCTYTSTIIKIDSGLKFPPGWASSDVQIAGLYDAQGGNVISIDTKTCRYTGGLNCVSHDVYVETRTKAGRKGLAFWRLSGEFTIFWTSPVSGTQYENVFFESNGRCLFAEDDT